MCSRSASTSEPSSSVHIAVSAALAGGDPATAGGFPRTRFRRGSAPEGRGAHPGADPQPGARRRIPEALGRRRPAARTRWIRSYVGALLDRDVQELAHIGRLADLPALMAALAHRSGGLLNVADVSRMLGVPVSTLHRYLVLLERMYVMHRIPAWHRNAARRLAKTPKLLLNDAGLAAVLTGTDASRLDADPPWGARLLETFVGMELLKQIGWAARPPRLLHFRTAKGQEVDFVLEDPSGDCVGI